MNDQDADPSNGQDIQRQFALLQDEMKRAMAAPPAAANHDSPPPDEAAELRRIELGLDELRRDADRLRSRLSPTAEEAAATAAALSEIRARVDAVVAQVAVLGKRTEDTGAWLGRALQTNLQAIDDLGARVEAIGRRRPSRWLVALAILLGALAIAAAIVVSVPGRAQMLIDRAHALAFPAKPHADAIPPAPVAPAPVAPPPVAQAPAKSASAAPAQSAPSPALTAPVAPAPADVPAPPPAPPIVAAAPPPVVAAPAPAPAVEPPPPIVAAVVPPPPAPAASAPPAPARPAPPSQIVIRAKADAWVEVRNRQGGALLQRVFHPGETWAVPDGGMLVMSTGNAGGVELLVDGTPAPPLGGSGVIRRDVPLDPDLVRAGRYAPDQPGRSKPTTDSR